MSEAACCEGSCGRTVSRVETCNFDVSECEYWPGHRIPEHEHRRATFCLVLDGAFEEHSAGEALRYESATLLYRPAGARHANIISTRGSRCLEVAIAPSVIASLPKSEGAAEAFTAGWQGSAPWFVYKMRAELQGTDDLTPLVVDGVGLALLGEFARSVRLRPGRRAPPWLERTRERLREEFVRPASLAELAEDAGVHRVHLARAFREHYACTVGEYVRRRRIELACHLLAMTEAPLSDVALSAGFADQSHFTGAFKRVVGVTPGEFRLRLRKNPGGR